jgi:hypothetical protein
MRWRPRDVGASNNSDLSSVADAFAGSVRDGTTTNCEVTNQPPDLTRIYNPLPTIMPNRKAAESAMIRMTKSSLGKSGFRLIITQLMT